MVMTSYGRHKNRNDEIIKNQERANNRPSYRRAAIRKTNQCHYAAYERKPTREKRKPTRDK